MLALVCTSEIIVQNSDIELTQVISPQGTMVKTQYLVVKDMVVMINARVSRYML